MSVETEVEITPKDLQAFEELWIEWSKEGNNLDLMEAGGLPEVRSLAGRALAWAAEVDQPKAGKQGKGRAQPRAPDGSEDSDGVPRDC